MLLVSADGRKRVTEKVTLTLNDQTSNEQVAGTFADGQGQWMCGGTLKRSRFKISLAAAGSAHGELTGRVGSDWVELTGRIVEVIDGQRARGTFDIRKPLSILGTYKGTAVGQITHIETPSRGTSEITLDITEQKPDGTVVGTLATSNPFGFSAKGKLDGDVLTLSLGDPQLLFDEYGSVSGTFSRAGGLFSGRINYGNMIYEIGFLGQMCRRLRPDALGTSCSASHLVAERSEFTRRSSAFISHPEMRDTRCEATPNRLWLIRLAAAIR